MHLIKQTTFLIAMALLTACGGEEEQSSSVIETTPIAQSQTPDNNENISQIVFIPAVNSDILLGGEVSSTPITIDISGEEPISITNGVYSIGGGEFISEAATIKNGEVLVIKQVLPNEYETSITTTVTIGTTTLSFINSTGKAPFGYVKVPEGAISINSKTDFTKVAYYDANNTKIKQVDHFPSITSFAEIDTDKATIALFTPHDTNQTALVFLSLSNKHYDYDASIATFVPRYDPEECKSFTVMLNGLSGYELQPSFRYKYDNETNFEVAEYNKTSGEATVLLTSCEDEGLIITEKNADPYDYFEVSYIDIPVGEIVDGDVVSLTMKEPVLVTVQVDNAEFTIITSLNEDNTAHNSSSSSLGNGNLYAFPTQNGHYVANFSSIEIHDNDDFKNQFFNYSQLPENNVFSENMFDIEIETVDFDHEALTFNYSVSGNDTPSVVLFSLKITYEAMVDGVAKEFNTRTSVFSQHSTKPISFPNVHEEYIPEGAEIIKITGKLHAIKTTFYNDLDTAMGFGVNANTFMPYGFSDDYESSGFFTSEYFTFFENTNTNTNTNIN
tara:strand:+ start:8386 stop:10059 length:1674 start_codon:yes stop_codon:yes gene_type:complete